MIHEALYYEKLEGGDVRCHLCPNRCFIAAGKSGLCGVRRNDRGMLVTEVYGLTTGLSLDPIEKKPLYRYHSGEYILSLGTKGCNFHCGFCQNWHISQELDAPTQKITSEEIVRKAKANGSFGIAYTYNEPFIWYEFVLDTARCAQKSGLENVLVTNGYVNPEPLEEMLPFISAMNIDLKSFDDTFYTTVCGGRLDPVLDVIKRSSRRCHVELTNLIIPTLNDAESTIRGMVEWIASNLGPDLPLHLSRYFPCYRMSIPETPLETMRMAQRIAKEKLRYVYLGNI